MLKIFNTLTKKKEIFKPINLNKIKLYVCGITVYDLCHLGHGRIFVIFDTIVRYLYHCGYNVEYVRNITDIDDKIICRAYENNETIDQLTYRMIQEMYLDLDKLNILRPNYEPKVTDYIDIIVQYISLLVQKKHAYINRNGDVMFSIKSSGNYGILSKRRTLKAFNTNIIYNNSNINEKISKDFVLWKSTKPGEPYWLSPWGKGRPGWHIECSAMSHAILGEQIDIHGGGVDLIFPHHDNELAQSISAYDNFCVNIWMHCGMLLLCDKKMSKSSNNFFTIRESFKHYNPETIRFFLLSAHYRNELRYSEDNLKHAQTSIRYLYIALRGIDPLSSPNGGEYFIHKFFEKINDDFNTPAAYSVLFEVARKLNVLKKNKCYFLAQGMAATLKYLGNILGILYQHPETYLKTISSCCNTTYYDEKKIYELIKIRNNARKNSQWELADNIRKQLRAMGIILEDADTIDKTKWRYNL